MSVKDMEIFTLFPSGSHYLKCQFRRMSFLGIKKENKERGKRRPTIRIKRSLKRVKQLSRAENLLTYLKRFEREQNAIYRGESLAFEFFIE